MTSDAGEQSPWQRPAGPSFEPAANQPFPYPSQATPAQGNPAEGYSSPGYQPQGYQQQSAPGTPSQPSPVTPMAQAPLTQTPMTQTPMGVPSPLQHSYGMGSQPEQPLPPEHVGRGLPFACGGVLVSMVVTALIYRLGYIASITGIVLAAACAWLYIKGSGGRVKKGVVPLLALIAIGAIASFAACILADVDAYYNAHVAQAASMGRLEYDVTQLLDLSVWQENSTNFLMYLLFAVIGIFGTARSIVRGN